MLFQQNAGDVLIIYLCNYCYSLLLEINQYSQFLPTFIMIQHIIVSSMELHLYPLHNSPFYCCYFIIYLSFSFYENTFYYFIVFILFFLTVWVLLQD